MVKIRSQNLILAFASCILLLSSINISSAQEITARASTDKVRYQVGDYINYTITVHCDKGFKIYPPALVTDSLKNVSLIQKEKPVQEEENGKVNVTFKYILSGYDSSGVNIPPVMVPYQASNDSTTRFAFTNGLSFIVSTLKVNPQGEIKDVKPPMKILLNWKLILFWSLIGLFIAGILLYVYLQHRKRKGKLGPEEKVAALPSHVIALNALHELEQRKLWQKGMVKEYHSTITEIIRRYFEDRFEMPAMELPTSEAVELLRRNRETEPILEITHDFLSNADMVKFAKFMPLNSVNEEMMKQALEIVNKTVPVEEPKENGSGGLVRDEVPKQLKTNREDPQKEMKSAK
jgi:hypothetical protein